MYLDVMYAQVKMKEFLWIEGFQQRLQWDQYSSWLYCTENKQRNRLETSCYLYSTFDSFIIVLCDDLQSAFGSRSSCLWTDQVCC